MTARKQKLTREAWLSEFAKAQVKHDNGLFKQVDLKKVRIGVGFPGGGSRTTRIGEAWHNSASADGTYEIIISPLIGDGDKAAGILAHELCHIQDYINGSKGHSPTFGKLARSIGLEGKLTATTEGEEFFKWARPVLNKLGKYPHGALQRNGSRKKQTTRLVKCECEDCGFIFRTTAKWINECNELTCPDKYCQGTVNPA